MLNDEVLLVAEEVLGAEPKIEFLDEYETTTVLVCDRYRIRAKKIDEYGRSSNLLTTRQLDLRHQHLLFDLDVENAGETRWVTLGYEPDDTEMNLSRVVLAVDSPGGRYWIYTIPEEPSESFQLRHPAHAEMLERLYRDSA